MDSMTFRSRLTLSIFGVDLRTSAFRSVIPFSPLHTRRKVGYSWNPYLKHQNNLGVNFRNFECTHQVWGSKHQQADRRGNPEDPSCNRWPLTFLDQTSWSIYRLQDSSPQSVPQIGSAAPTTWRTASPLQNGECGEKEEEIILGSLWLWENNCIYFDLSSWVLNFLSFQYILYILQLWSLCLTASCNKCTPFAERNVCRNSSIYLVAGILRFEINLFLSYLLSSSDVGRWWWWRNLGGHRSCLYNKVYYKTTAGRDEWAPGDVLSQIEVWLGRVEPIFI